MMTRSLFNASLLALSVSLSLSACAGQTGTDGATDDASLSDDGKADRAGGGSSYFLVRPDQRRCASPTCGGSFVERVNFDSTTCVDGKSAAECYVAAVDYSKAKLDGGDLAALSGRPIIVKASIVKTRYASGTFGTLAVSEVWVAAVGTTPASGYATVSGVVYRATDRGVRCITSPCLTDHELKINGTTSRDIAGVDLSAVGASDDQISSAYTAMTTADGVLVDGHNVTVTGPAGSALQLAASTFYTRVAHQATGAAIGQACGGIAGIVCADGLWCDPTPANACGGADLMGSCKDPGFLCSQIYLPVCGCDGKTYSNDCVRVQSSAQLAHDGACAN
jgi:hypothetical protein